MRFLYITLTYNMKGVLAMNYIAMLSQLIAALPPEAQAAIKAELSKMDKRAKETKLPFDDIAVGFLHMLLGL